jgi:hypothetical protein
MFLPNKSLRFVKRSISILVAGHCA